MRHLEVTVKPCLEKLAIKSYAKVLLEDVKTKEHVLSKMDEIQIDTNTVERRKVNADSLYELLFDQYGQVKTNIGKKAVVRSECLELLETGGKAIGFESLFKKEGAFSCLKLNKSLKLVNTIPHFQSVPATAHLFDLAGSGI